LKIATIIGARPQFIKSAPVSSALRKCGHREFLIHTGQHYDFLMSKVFFEELGIHEPAINLGIGSASHGQQTGKMLLGLEEVINEQKPYWVLVYGDTNSTLAGALAAAKLHVPVAHVEAGLRSFNRRMPEEINRVLTDHISNLLFCPTQTAVENLRNEGINNGVHLVGDVMYDSVLHNTKLAEKHSDILEKLKIKNKNYALATVHRAENTDEPRRLKPIFNAFEQISQNGLPVIIPLHPRTKQYIKSSKLSLIDPVSYLDMLVLEKNAQIILTDSGGVQKEAYWFKVPCVTLRDETEWLETVESGWNVLAGSNYDRIINAVENAYPGQQVQDAYGDGRAAEQIANLISSPLS
jgi:UDP-GlcNAc3NAcA epimerase